LIETKYLRTKNIMTFTDKWIFTTLALIPLALGQMSHATPFYKWVDEQGATHYTQTPPPQKQVRKIDINAHVPSDSASAIKNLNTQTKADLKADIANEKTADKAKIAAATDAARREKNAPQCKQLKTNRALLQSGRRLRESDAKGESSYLTEPQKATQIEQANTQLQKNCP
jgi:hypothetical protein